MPINSRRGLPVFLSSVARWVGLAIAFFLLSPFALHAQTQTSNKFVTAKVEGDNGKVTIYTTAGGYYGRNAQPLSYLDMSFLTLNIDGLYWTNNDISGFASRTDFGGYLHDGTTKITGVDTIETVWRLPNGDVIQDVYPVEFNYSGQIVLKWKFRARTPQSSQIVTQYLLDTYIADNDQAKVLTRWGYNRRWSEYFRNNTNINYNEIPPFYQAFQHDLQKTTNFSPGVVSQGTFINEDLGLMVPDAVLVGDWGVLSYYIWGGPHDLPYDEYHDSAVLMTFPGVGTVYQKEIELGRTAYGTGEFETCYGELYGLVFRPRVIKANAAGDDYKPNPFNVDVYLFNTSDFTGADNTSATLTVGPHLKIVDPPGATNNGTVLKLDAKPARIPLAGVTALTWKVFAEKDCNEDTTFLKIEANSTLGTPSFVDTCRLPVALPCLDKDTMPPIADPIVTSGFFKSVDFHDDRQKDKGIQKIETTGDVTHFRVTVGQFAPCTKSKVNVQVEQLDSTVAGCIDIRVTDCAGNITNQSICFPRYPLHPDTLAPRITLISSQLSFDSSLCNAKYDTLLAIDDTVYDKGLATVNIAPGTQPVNMQLQSLPFTKGAARHGFAITVLDSMVDGSIVIRATDAVGNYIDDTLYYCTIPDRNPPMNIVFQTSPYSWSIHTEDVNPYDRKIDTIDVFNRVNVAIELNGLPFEPTRAFTRGKERFDFNIHVIDTLKYASFCLHSKDLADSSSLDPKTHWWTETICYHNDTTTDRWVPNISVDPPIETSPTVINVTVDDIHLYGKDTIGWDKGVDSIWFTNVRGFIVPPTIHAGCSKVAPTFKVYVADTLALDSLSTLCIHYVDCAGNGDSLCWHYPITEDDQPPLITSIAANKLTLDLLVTDTARYDRGLKHANLVNGINFDPYDLLDSGGREITVPLKVTKAGESATGELDAIDLAGSASNSAMIQSLHTAKAPLSIWVQDAHFKKSQYAKQDADVEVPVYLTSNDTFTIVRKGLTKFSFAFDLLGDQGFSYAGVRTNDPNWNVAGVAVSNRITVAGTSITGDSLSSIDSPICYVIIHCAKSESTRKAIIQPVGTALNSIIYNDGIDRIITGKNYKVRLPAPYGSISGGTIVAVGSCAPSVTSSTTPTSVSLDQNSPNPFNHSTKLGFTIPETGYVQLTVYNSLGMEVSRLVNTDMMPGAYSIEFNGQGLPHGTYYARLEANGKVLTKHMELTR